MAAGVALGAYVTWRRPDVARRNSETAQLVMRTSSLLEAATLAARHRGYYPKPRNDLQKLEFLLTCLTHLQATLKPEELTTLSNRINDTETYSAEVRKIFDEKAANLLLHFVSLCRLVETELEGLPTLVAPNEMYADSPSHIRWLEMAAPILGQIEDDFSARGVPEDKFEQSLKMSGNALRTHLSAWL